MKHELKPLSYELTALEPHISKETLELHWGKHLQTYVTNLNGLVEGTDFASKSLVDIVKTATGGMFNNAAQIFNHEFYFETLSGSPKLAPTGELLSGIEKTWGTLDKFKEEMSKAALTQFGSGWAWLVKNSDGSLGVVQTSNAATPLTTTATPLLTIDVWEHAYYVDYRNRRADYIASVWNVIDWTVVEARFKG